jgi:splicing factor 3A subunit 3
MRLTTCSLAKKLLAKFMDLTTIHELYLNLPSIKRLTYLQYLDAFDSFVPPALSIKRPDKMTDQYFNYVGELAKYLESFMRRTRPLEDLEKLFKSFDEDFDKAWDDNDVTGWKLEIPAPWLDLPPMESGAQIVRRSSRTTMSTRLI